MFGWLSRRRREQELDRELRCHLQAETEEQTEKGLAPDQAQQAAHRLLGNLTLTKEDVRIAWGSGALERLFQDMAYGFRLFRKAPGFTAVVLITLALGIGANTAVFTILKAVLLEPLPFNEPDRLVVIWDHEIHAQGTSKLFDLYSDYENWKANSRQFEAVAAVSWAPQASPSRVFKGHGPASRIFALPVTPEFFRLLGRPALLGRTIEPQDAGQGCKVVLTFKFWQTTFSERHDAVGSTVRLDDQPCAVIGVMPAGFGFLPPGAPVAMWTIMPRPTRPNELGVAVFARLRPGVSLQSAQAEALFLHRQIHSHDRWGAQMEPVIYNLHEEFTWLTGRNLRLSLIVLFTAVSFVLLICCVNVANLLLGRAVGREREMAIRAALGSGAGRLVRQLLTENLLLSLSAAVVGVGLAALTVWYFRLTHPVEMPPATAIELNAPVLVFAVVLALVTTLLFGLVPALRASRVDLNDALKTGGRTSSRTARQQRFGKQLIVAEVMLTVVLLAGAWLLIQSIARFASVPLGFNPDGLLITSVSLPENRYHESQRKLLFYDRLRGDLGQVLGVQAVALSSAYPVEGGGFIDVTEVEGQPVTALKTADTMNQTVSSDYFGAMQIALKSGRGFRMHDSQQSEPVAIINESLAREYFGNERPLGRRIRPFIGSGDYKGPWLRVVGVVGDEKRNTVYNEMAWVDPPILYRPLRQNPLSSVVIIARASKAGHSNVAAALTRKIAAIDPDVPAEEIQTARDLQAQVLSFPRFRAVLLGALAGIALLLAATGLFGVLAHSVAQRIQEIGIRVALGAERNVIVAMILSEGLLLVGSGILLGTLASWGLSRYISALLFGVRPDPLLFATCALVLLPAALLAMYIPIRRASRVDPMIALRYE
jgi:putative ABC transport system permease protein